MSKLKILITFFFFLANFNSVCFATTYDREFIQNFAKRYVEKNIPVPKHGILTVTPAKIDPRIAIKQCSMPLSANIPEKTASRNVNVKIYCAGSTPWQLFLPVKVTTSIPVIVAANKLSKGTFLDSSNLIIELRDIRKIRGEVIDNIQKVTGARAKRSLLKGTTITKRNICVVCKGESVTIIAKSADFSIKTAGIALKDASFGEQVKVKNSRSGRTIIAQVKAINQVVINL